jgi:lipopolysaccharide transport system permease protein
VRFVHFAIALPLLGGLLWSRGLQPSVAWSALPLLVVIQYLLAVGLTYPLASLNVLFRDTQHIVTVLLQLLMFASPVFYSPATMPEAFRAWYQFNPMAVLMEAWRAVLLRGAWPDFGTLGLLALAALALVAVGRRVFIAQSHRFVEEM